MGSGVFTGGLPAGVGDGVGVGEPSGGVGEPSGGVGVGVGVKVGTVPGRNRSVLVTPSGYVTVALCRPPGLTKSWMG